MQELLIKFKLNKLSKNESVKYLHNNELIKLNIIANLVKESNYIFIDDVTSNLDDESLKVFIDIIEELALVKTIILLTNDKRLTIKDYKHIRITKDEIYNNYKKTDIKNENIKNYPYGKVALFLFEKRFYLLIILLLFNLIFLITNLIVFKKYYSTEKLPPNNGFIITYTVDYRYDELNQKYAKYTGLDGKIKKTNYQKLILYEDIPKIANMNNVEKVYYSNDDYLELLMDKYYNNTLLNEMNFLSLPNEVMINYDDVIGLPIIDLINGRLPKDKHNEVVISRKLLELYYSDISTDEAIGKEILFNDKKYTIVGIGYYDICLISYEDGYSYGFSVYNNSNFNQEISKIIEYKTDNDYNHPNIPNYVVVKTKINHEKEVLDSLLINFLANNFYSYNFVYYFIQAINEQMLKNTYTINIIVSLLIAVILFYIHIKQHNKYKNISNFYDNYYLTRQRTKKLIKMIDIIQGLLILLFVYILKTSYSEINQIIFINSIIVISPLYLQYFIERRVYDEK